MYCHQCGQQIDDDSRFCRHCGVAQIPAVNTINMANAPPDAETSSSPPSATQVRAAQGPIAFIWWAVGSVILLIIISTVMWSGSGSSSNASIPANAEAAAADEMTMTDNVGMTADVPVTAPDSSGVGGWSYSTDEDKVRGGTTYFARLTSANTVHQNAPYDDATTMNMTVRQSPAFGTDVVLTISSGQMMCPSYEGCSGTVRFDDGSAQRVSFNGPSDNSSDTVFVIGAKAFIAKLKKAKHVVIEKTLYEAGNPQFEFNVAGLKWDH